MNIEIVDRLNQIEIQEQVRNCRNRWRCSCIFLKLEENRLNAHVKKQIGSIVLYQETTKVQETDLKHISKTDNSLCEKFYVKKQI